MSAEPAPTMVWKTPEEMCEHMRWLGDEAGLIRWGQTSMTGKEVMPVVSGLRWLLIGMYVVGIVINTIGLWRNHFGLPALGVTLALLCVAWLLAGWLRRHPTRFSSPLGVGWGRAYLLSVLCLALPDPASSMGLILAYGVMFFVLLPPDFWDRGRGRVSAWLSARLPRFSRPVMGGAAPAH